MTELTVATAHLIYALFVARFGEEPEIYHDGSQQVVVVRGVVGGKVVIFPLAEEAAKSMLKYSRNGIYVNSNESGLDFITTQNLYDEKVIILCANRVNAIVFNRMIRSGQLRKIEFKRDEGGIWELAQA